MRIGIIGVGVIGEVLLTCFRKKGFDVVGYDKYDKKYQDFKEVLDTDIIFLCLPTIAKKNGEMDLTPFEITLLKLKDYRGLVVIKSSVLPGITKTFSEKYPFRIVHCPEFLTMSTRYRDFMNPEFTVLGKPDMSMSTIEFYEVFKHFPGSIIETDSNTSEFFKLMKNCFYATKIVFANEMNEIASVYGADYERAKSLLYMDKRCAPDQLNINKERRFSNACLPKDSNQLIKDLNKHGFKPIHLTATKEVNERAKKLVKLK